MADLSKYVTEAEIRDLLDSFFDDFPGNSRRPCTAAENTAHTCTRIHTRVLGELMSLQKRLNLAGNHDFPVVLSPCSDDREMEFVQAKAYVECRCVNVAARLCLGFVFVFWFVFVPLLWLCLCLRQCFCLCSCPDLCLLPVSFSPFPLYPSLSTPSLCSLSLSTLSLPPL
jgi:hypothetical protein